MAPPITPLRYEELPLGTLDPDRVEALWRYAHGERRPQLVLPDGRMDLVAHAMVHRGGRVDAVTLAIAGPADQPCAMQLRPGMLSLGVRFQLGWGGVCCGVAPALARNRVIVGQEAAALLGLAAQPLLQCRSVAALQAALAHAAAVLSAGASSNEGHVRALQAIARVRTHVAADRASLPPTDEAERSLRRHVLAATGLSLRSLAGVLRFQRAMALLTSGTVASLADLAASTGYADQSHMTRAFRRFGGFTPALPISAPVVGAW